MAVVEVGQPVLVRPRDLRGRVSGYEGTVSKVGRVYFTVVRDGFRSDRGLQFHMDTMTEKTDYTPQYQVFTSQQEYDDHMERQRLLVEVHRKFSTNVHRLTLAELREVHAMLCRNDKAVE